MTLIYTIIILIIFIISLYYTFKYSLSLGPNSPNVNLGYGTSKEKVSTLLNRIEWSNHYYGRINYYVRYSVYAIIITFFCSIIYKSTNTLYFLQSVIIVWLILVKTNSFYTHHIDKFNSYFINKNINHIRKKLKLKKSGKLKNNKRKFKGSGNCFNFIYF